MDKKELLLAIEAMFNHVSIKDFPRLSGRIQFLKEVENVADFVNAHRTEAVLNAAMFNELKSKFDALVERTKKDEKKT